MRLCSDPCISQAQQEMQSNAASLRVGLDEEQRATLLRRNAQLMEAMLHHRSNGAAQADGARSGAP